MIKYDYKSKLPLIPSEPGIYKYFDDKGKIIYIGKAKDLRKRVSSYFYNYDRAAVKTRRLVSSIADIKYTVVPTEWDALLLENNLIKEYQPKYNILLRDDKTYPYILVTDEPFPRVISTRNVEDRKRGKLYGPYVSARSMHALLDMFYELYTIRTCKYKLTPENIKAKKFKVCLEYHLGNCLGPCEGLQSEEDYMKEIEQVHDILKGNLAPAKKYFKENMEASANMMNFEEAHRWKSKLEFLEKYQAKSTVVTPRIEEADVITIQSDDKFAFINYLKIVNGAIIQTHTMDVRKQLDEEDSEILSMMILELQNKYESEAKEIITNIQPDIDFNAKITIPKVGDKYKLMDMSMRNITFYRLEKAEKAAIAKTGTTNRRDRVLIQMKQDLRLPTLPRHIETFDNSNTQGTNPVSAMVSFINGQPSHKNYRHFIPRTVEGPDDYATMREVVERRYKRLIEEGKDLPDLIIIDGGKGQLSAACDALKKLDIYGKVPIIGIAERLEEIYFPGDSVPIYIDKRSETLKLIQRCRDEAHRFGLNHHRNRRSKSFLVSKLESVPGVGKVTATKALKHFKSIGKIKAASNEELIKVLGKDKARRISEFLKEED